MSSRIAPIDSVFLSFDTQTTHQAIASFCVLDRMPNLAELRDRVQALVRKFPRLTMKVSPRRQRRWVVDREFDVSRHLVCEHQPWMRSKEDLFSAIEKCFSRPLDLDRPLWRFTLISNQQDRISQAQDIYCGILFTIHHAFADGVGGLQLIENLWSDEQNAGLANNSASKFRADQAVLNRKQQRLSPLLRSGQHHFDRASSIFRWFGEYLSPVAQGPLNGFNSSGRCLAVTQFDIAGLKAVRERMGVAFNDVLLAIVSGAVRRYYSSVDLPYQDVRALIPVNLRSAKQQQSLGNRISGVGLKLPITVASPIEQLRRVNSNFQKLRKRGALGAYVVLGTVIAKLPRAIQRRLCEAQARRTNFICTNVLVSEQPKFLCGAEIKENYGLAALMRGHGVAFGFLGYAGKICASVVSDEKIIPDPWPLVRFLEEAVQNLLTEMDSAAS